MRVLSTVLVFFCAVYATPIFGEDEKPITLTADELAVLADRNSPDHKALLEKLDGKILKFTGKMRFSGGAVYGPDARSNGGFSLEYKTKASKVAYPRIAAKWTERKEDKAVAKRIELSIDHITVTIYGRAKFSEVIKGKTFYRNEGLADVSTDPKVAANPPKSRNKD